MGNNSSTPPPPPPPPPQPVQDQQVQNQDPMTTAIEFISGPDKFIKSPGGIGKLMNLVMSMTSNKQKQFGKRSNRKKHRKHRKHRKSRSRSLSKK